ncbi:MAG: hypothetical protein NTU53_06715 [Planctomycetota bacterium]|nr:hypothetical protein [Planctomycetota bacterium]
MPVRQINPTRSSDHQALVRDLVAEWTKPSGSPEPVILEELDQKRKLAHVYVVWTKWSDIDRVERSEIIMDAAEKRLSAQDVLNITIAMGLTPDEARQMGLAV